jgi:hypothetical protein
MRQPKQQQFAPKISLKRLTAKSNNLQSLIKQASERKSLEDILNETLPAAFKGKFMLNSFSQGVLILTCPSAALMTKFRFSQDQFLAMLNAKIHPEKVTQIKVKVRPHHMQPQKSAKNTTQAQNRLSKKNAQILLEEAEHTDDLKLKEVLLQLAKHSD